jgi:hypothetical protein
MQLSVGRFGALTYSWDLNGGSIYGNSTALRPSSGESRHDQRIGHRPTNGGGRRVRHAGACI